MKLSAESHSEWCDEVDDAFLPESPILHHVTNTEPIQNSTHVTMELHGSSEELIEGFSSSDDVGRSSAIPRSTVFTFEPVSHGARDITNNEDLSNLLDEDKLPGQCCSRLYNVARVTGLVYLVDKITFELFGQEETYFSCFSIDINHMLLPN